MTLISTGGGIVSLDHQHLIILDGHCSHVLLDMVQEAGGIGKDILTLPFHKGMSKQTTYSKIYCLDVCFIQMFAFVVQTFVRICTYPTDAFLSTDKFLLVHTNDKNASIQTWHGSLQAWVPTGLDPHKRSVSVLVRLGLWMQKTHALHRHWSVQTWGSICANTILGGSRAYPRLSQSLKSTTI